MRKIVIHHGDNRLILREFADAAFDSCVTDPPYELGFMGKKWDKSGISYDVAMWREVYRVLKPGAHLLAFGGARTYHRLACAIEDAGFQIRDQIMWLYGSGFPKSLDVGKAIDKAAGAEREVIGGVIKAKPTYNSKNIGGKSEPNNYPITAPAPALARQWDGWGTALKPAHEPIVVARKPLAGTVVENITCWGCGGLNLAACMVEVSEEDAAHTARPNSEGKFYNSSKNRLCYGNFIKNICHKEISKGRWPANVIHDGSEEVLAEFEKQSEAQGLHYAANKHHVTRKAVEPSRCFGARAEGGYLPIAILEDRSYPAAAARFFYCAKASQEERNLGCECRAPLKRDESRKEGNPGGDNPRNRGVRPVKNNHPTVKPLALMCYLVRLVTPPGGVVLDHFLGSGSTLIAAAKEGFDAVGIELGTENCEIAARRCRGHLGMLAEVKCG